MNRRAAPGRRSGGLRGPAPGPEPHPSEGMAQAIEAGPERCCERKARWPAERARATPTRSDPPPAAESLRHRRATSCARSLGSRKAVERRSPAWQHPRIREGWEAMGSPLGRGSPLAAAAGSLSAFLPEVGSRNLPGTRLLPGEAARPSSSRESQLATRIVGDSGSRPAATGTKRAVGWPPGLSLLAAAQGRIEPGDERGLQAPQQANDASVRQRSAAAELEAFS